MTRKKEFPNRTREHELETESRIKFENLLSQSGWKSDFSKMDQEYGIDGNVEIFENNRATGLFFNVQLKATDAEEEPASISLPISTFNYYTELSKRIPVLMVLYHAKTQSVYIRWFHSFDSYYDKTGKKAKRPSNPKTISFYWKKEDLWNDNSLINLFNEVRRIAKLDLHLKTPIKILLEYENPTIFRTPVSVILSKLQGIVNDNGVVEFTINEQDEYIGKLNIAFEEIKASIANKCGFVIHYSEKEIDDKIFISYCIFALALALGNRGFYNYYVLLIEQELKNLKFLPPFEIIIFILGYLYKAHSWNILLDFLRLLNDIAYQNGDEQLINEITLTSFKFTLEIRKLGIISSDINEKIKLIYQDYIARVKETNDMNTLGAAYYNLGNYETNLKIKLKYYNKARKARTKYIESGYYFKELAGILFELRRYKLSAKFYKKSIKLGEKDNTLALYADALMFSGKYKHSLKIFNMYFNQYNNENILPKDFLWYLKQFVLYEIVSKGCRYQSRNTILAYQELSKLNWNDTDDNPKLKNLNTILENDMLCGDAWFNLGILASKEYSPESYLNVSLFFLMAALCNSTDNKSWIYAHLFLAVYLKNLIDIKGITNLNDYDQFISFICSSTLYTGYMLNKDNYFSEFVQIVEESNFIDETQKSEFLNELYKQINKVFEENKDTEPTVLRFTDNTVEVEIIKFNNKGEE